MQRSILSLEDMPMEDAEPSERLMASQQIKNTYVGDLVDSTTWKWLGLPLSGLVDMLVALVVVLVVVVDWFPVGPGNFRAGDPMHKLVVALVGLLVVVLFVVALPLPQATLVETSAAAVLAGGCWLWLWVGRCLEFWVLALVVARLLPLVQVHLVVVVAVWQALALVVARWLPLVV